MRLTLSAVFGIAANAQNRLRLSKVFNPVFGETFEYVAENYRYFTE